MTTLALLTTATLNMLEGLDLDERPKQDTLNGSITSGAVSLTPTTTSTGQPRTGPGRQDQ